MIFDDRDSFFFLTSKVVIIWIYLLLDTRVPEAKHVPHDLVRTGKQCLENRIGRRRAPAGDERAEAEDGLARHALVRAPRVRLVDAVSVWLGAWGPVVFSSARRRGLGAGSWRRIRAREFL